MNSKAANTGIRRARKTARDRGYLKNDLQAQKSAATRESIMEATTQCLVKYGYAQTTTLRIAEEAGLSRGAMTHHFLNRQMVIEATTEYLGAHRIRALHRTLSTMYAARTDSISAVNVYWKSLLHPQYLAFHELKVASRRDKVLDNVVRKTEREFQREWRDSAGMLLQIKGFDAERFSSAVLMVELALEGLANRHHYGASNSAFESGILRQLEDFMIAWSE